jgi:transcription antitermination protein NusB
MEIILYGGMNMSRKEARESAMQLVYQISIGQTNADEILSSYHDNLEVSLADEEKAYIDECVKGVEQNLSEIDSYIERFSRGWKVNRIAKVDMAIMRLALYEMLHMEGVPKVVSVNEAIELAKKYGGDNSPSFINGILGNIIKELN